MQVAETGSLGRAAQALGLFNAAANRHLSAFKARLGARLIEGNTRRLYLTETGQEFFTPTKGMLVDLKDAESAFNAISLNPTDILRITTSLSFSLNCVAPVLREYTQRHPNVNVHIEPDSNIPIRRLAETGHFGAAVIHRRVRRLHGRALCQDGLCTQLNQAIWGVLTGRVVTGAGQRACGGG